MNELINDNLLGILSIVKKHNQEIEKIGGRFNIFSILNLSSNEVRLHSNFIGVLLNPKGTHSFKNVFCKLFIEKISEICKDDILKIFNFNNYIVEVEKYIGLINQDYTSGGRIDIVLTDIAQNRIIIENKIFASDQKNQLLRYYNYDKKALILYLTLNGTIPSEWSTKGEIQYNVDFYCISYRTFILAWLEECINLSYDKPNIKETISQYLNIIKDYTDQNENKKMINEITNLIANNKDLYNSIDEIFQAYNLFRQSVCEKFWKIIREKRPSETICITEDGIEIKFEIDEDSEGFYFGFLLEKNGNKIDGTSESVSYLATIFKEINVDFKANNKYIGWIFSNAFSNDITKFFCLDKEKIFELNNDNEMINFTNQIFDELDMYINSVNEMIKNSKQPKSV